MLFAGRDAHRRAAGRSQLQCQRIRGGGGPLADVERAGFGGAFDRADKDEPAERAAAIEKLRAVTVMFEAARAAATTTPEWGAAEAYAFLGRALYAQRDVVGAREALERALLIAPDYGFARRLMAQITR